MTELEQEIAHLQELRAKHRKNIRRLEETLASYGMERPLKLVNELEFEQEQLRQVEEHLAELAGQTGKEEAPTGPVEPAAGPRAVQVSVTGSGAAAVGERATSAGEGGVAVGGDMVYGDKVGGDKVAGDKVVVSTHVRDVHGGTVITAGRDVSIGQRITNLFWGSIEQQRAQRNRRAMLELVRNTWVKGVLEQSLHGAAMIELGLEERADAVERPWDMVLQTPDQPNRPLPPGTKIVDVFDEMNRALLILGAPGSGKTITLLELARDTIVCAEGDSTQPIPVVFNLSSWVDKKQPIAEWLVDELNAKYTVPKKIARSWVENDDLLLLLDGLDEVKLDRREDCVRAINDFRQEHLVSLVVCSRVADYEALTTRLKLRGAVFLQSLTPRQVDEYLEGAGIELLAVRRTLQHDTTLQELTQSPLMLSIMTIAYKGRSIQDLRLLDTQDARRKHVFGAYVKQMFKRRGAAPSYPPQQTIHWLTWLAQKMSQYGQSVFLIERMQPSWLDTRLRRRLYVIIMGLVIGLIVGLVGVLGIGLSDKLIVELIVELFLELRGGQLGGVIVLLMVGLSVVLIVVLIGGLRSGLIGGMADIVQVEVLKYLWREVKKLSRLGSHAQHPVACESAPFDTPPLKARKELTFILIVELIIVLIIVLIVMLAGGLIRDLSLVDGATSAKPSLELLFDRGDGVGSILIDQRRKDTAPTEVLKWWVSPTYHVAEGSFTKLQRDGFQLKWWVSPTWYLAAKEVKRCLIGLLIVVLSTGWVGGLIIVLIDGLKDPAPIRVLKLLQKEARKGLFVGLVTLLSIGLIIILSGGLIVGLTIVLIAELIIVLNFGLIAVLIVGWVIGQEDIVPIEVLKWSQKEARKGLIFGLLCGLIIGLFCGRIIAHMGGLAAGQIAVPIGQLSSGLFIELYGGLIGGVILGLFAGLNRGLGNVEVETKVIPNQGILQSAKNAVIGGLIIALIVGLIVALSGGLIVGLGSILKAELIAALAFWLFYGGAAVIQHFILRFLLYRSGHIPWNYARFLDYAAERIFLRKVGGGYIFIHRLLQDYFASLD